MSFIVNNARESLFSVCKSLHFSSVYIDDEEDTLASFLSSRALQVKRRQESVNSLEQELYAVKEGLASPCDVAICCLSLYRDSAALKTMGILLDLTPHLLIVDWLVPQRNLDYLFFPFSLLFTFFSDVKLGKKYFYYAKSMGALALAQHLGVPYILEKKIGFGFFDLYLMQKTKTPHLDAFSRI